MYGAKVAIEGIAMSMGLIHSLLHAERSGKEDDVDGEGREGVVKQTWFVRNALKLGRIKFNSPRSDALAENFFVQHCDYASLSSTTSNHFIWVGPTLFS